MADVRDTNSETEAGDGALGGSQSIGKISRRGRVGPILPWFWEGWATTNSCTTVAQNSTTHAHT